jgi:hypothetical protein
MSEIKIRKVGKNIIDYDTSTHHKCEKHGLLPIDRFQKSYHIAKNPKTGIPYNNGKKYVSYGCLQCRKDRRYTKYHADPKGNNEKAMQWHQANRKRMREVQSQFYGRNKKIILDKLKIEREKCRLECLKAYSQEIICALCGENHYKFLVLDHICGGGNQQRKGIGSGTNHYKWVRRHGFPPGYRVLCHNCNQKESLKLSRSKKTYKSEKLHNKNQLFFKRLRTKCLEHYSKGEIKCACCEYDEIDALAIDHIDGGGNKQMRDLGFKSGHDLYQWLVKNNFPKGYRVLCFNCNFSNGLYGICPHQQIP